MSRQMYGKMNARLRKTGAEIIVSQLFQPFMSSTFEFFK